MNLEDLQQLPRSPIPTFYAAEFDKGKEYHNWRQGGSGDWLVIYTLGGSGMVGDGKNFYATQTNDLVVFERDAPQAYLTSPSLDRWHFVWSHCNHKPIGSSISGWHTPVPGVRMMSVHGQREQEEIVACLWELVRLTRSTLPLRTELGFNQMDRLLLLARQSLQAQKLVLIDHRVERTVHLLSHNFSEPFQLESLAAKVGFSPSRLSHLFRDQIGQTPRAFLEERRMNHARQLLQLTALSIADIAAECGYDSPFYFSNRFRLTFGKSPRDYRRSLKSSTMH